MKQIGFGFLVSALALPLLTGAVQAQINSPPPTLMGQPSYHLYSVPGVIEGGGIDTFFACTNTTGSNIRVGVELFGAAGGAAANDPSASPLDLSPGATRIFGTSATNWVVIDSNVGGAISRGSARVLATEKRESFAARFWPIPSTPHRRPWRT